MTYQGYAIIRTNHEAPIEISVASAKPLSRELWIVNESEHIITVRDCKDAPCVIQGHTAQRFYWDRDDCLWHKKD